MVSGRVCHFGGNTFFPPITLFFSLLQEEDKHNERTVLGHEQRYETLDVVIKEAKASCILLLIINVLCN